MKLARSVAIVAALLATIVGCDGKPATRNVSGTVVDARTGHALRGVSVTARGSTVTTDADGGFKFAGLPEKGVMFTASKQFYTDATTSEPTGNNDSLQIKLAPVPVTINVRSNLTEKPITATVTGGPSQANTSTGVATLYGIGSGSQVTVTAAGYASTSLTLTGTSVTITLIAGPKLGAQHLADLQIAQDWSGLWDLVHPAEKSYITEAALTKAFRENLDAGNGMVSFTIKSVTMLPTWRFPGCNGNGVRTLGNVAAVAYHEVDSAPAGGSSTFDGVEHLAQLSNGMWGWMPVLSPGCPAPTS